MPTAYTYYANHFDLVWRRCWNTSYAHRGLVYRSYRDVEDAVITRSLRLAEHEGAAFMLEQAYSLRAYLARHPETLPLFQRLAREGRFELNGSGEAIIDQNMCSGETMARNYASGVRYTRETLGMVPEIACHEDGFGSSAQFPQIARQCGMRGIIGLSYCKPDGPFWRGLDGSTVYVELPTPGLRFFYDHCYYEPCLRCKGEGTVEHSSCTTCEGTGLRLSQGVYPPREWIERLDAPVGRYVISSEEMMPDEQLPALLAERNAAEGPVKYAWGTLSALMPLWQAELDRVDAADVSLSSRVENNPIQSGTLVSRIRFKQQARLAEEAFYGAESLMALLTRGAQPALRERAEALWQDFPMLFFHDSITGTHIDPAHDELLDYAAGVVSRAHQLAQDAAALRWPSAQWAESWAGDGSIAVFNPLGVTASLPVEVPATGDGYAVTDGQGASMPVYHEPGQQQLAAGAFAPVGPTYWAQRDAAPPASLRFLAADVPPFSVKTFHIRQRAVQAEVSLTETVELNGYRLGWGETGVHSIVDLASGSELLNSNAPPLGHLMLEEDIGDPWGTRSLQRARTCCASSTRLLSAVRRHDAVELTFAGKLFNGTFGRENDPCTFGLEWYQTVRLLNGLPWIELDCEIFWQAVNRRIRIAFPSRAQTDRGRYHIPYGILARERYEMTETNLWSPNGDWPAVFFAATEPDGEIPGLAVLNSGTPSVRIEDGTLYYSVLRSPGFGHCLNRYAQEYPMPVSEMRDAGHHHFRFALLPNRGDNLSEILQAGYLFNRPAGAFQVTEAQDWTSGLAADDPGTVITTVKCAFDGPGLAVRVVEHVGQPRVAVIHVPDWVTSAARVNLLEENGETLPVHSGCVHLPLRAHEIATLRLQ
ncbi:MAG TPA: glycosyl hydrolase-related protein [Armatimonadota bacterium]